MAEGRRGGTRTCPCRSSASRRIRTSKPIAAARPPARAAGLLPGGVRPDEPLAVALSAGGRELEAEEGVQASGRRGRSCKVAEVSAPSRTGTGACTRPCAPARAVPITAIPYYAWDNRKAGPMKVWLPGRAPPVRGRAGDRRPKVTVSFANDNAQPRGINDGVEPKSSAASNRPRSATGGRIRNSEEWAQYTWTKPVTVGGAKVYWFDDTGRGACRLPASWQIQYLETATWKPVGAAKASIPSPKDQWCEVRFAPVTTTALRLSSSCRPTGPPARMNGNSSRSRIEAGSPSSLGSAHRDGTQICCRQPRLWRCRSGVVFCPGIDSDKCPHGESPCWRHLRPSETSPTGPAKRVLSCSPCGAHFQREVKSDLAHAGLGGGGSTLTTMAVMSSSCAAWPVKARVAS